MAELTRKFQNDKEASNDVAVYGSCNPVHLYEKIKRIGGKNHLIIFYSLWMYRNHISDFDLEAIYRFNSFIIDNILKNTS